VNTSEVLLTSLRKDLVNDFEIGECRYRRDQPLTYEPPTLYSEHAIDAALAGGATLDEIAAAVHDFGVKSFDRSRDGTSREALLRGLDDIACALWLDGDTEVVGALQRRMTELGAYDDGETQLRGIELFAEGELSPVFAAGIEAATPA
jgi:hypothetical protein